jgi:hypothetical protein
VFGCASGFSGFTEDLSGYPGLSGNREKAFSIARFFFRLWRLAAIRMLAQRGQAA